MKLRFEEGRVALVTGAGRGIGKSIAKMLGAAGVNVLCVSKSGTCEAVAAEIVAEGGRAKGYQVDVSDAKAVSELCGVLLEEYGNIDILVNNAGITRDGLLMKMSDEDWDSVISTNLSSAFYFTKALIRPMTKKRWGRIINISSVVGVMGNAGQYNYSAAKAGLIGATKSVAKEAAARGVTANVVAPGFIETDMTGELGDKVKEGILGSIPLKRMGAPEDIAGAVMYLASENGGYVTGQVFAVDGGMVM